MTPVVVLLGAGMGARGVARALAGAAHLVVVDRDEALAQRATSLAQGDGGSTEARVVDLLDMAAVTAFRDDLLVRHGRVDAVIHLVGGWRGSRTVDEDAIADWNMLVPGILGTLQTTSVVFREALRAAPRGRYVMVSSTAVSAPTAGNAGYASAKAAAETWLQALDESFSGSPARAVVVAVKGLVDQDMREREPDRRFPGFTDTDELGRAVAEILSDTDLDERRRIVLPPATG